MRIRYAVLVALAAVAACRDVIAPTLDGNGELQIRPAFVRTVEGARTTLDVVAFDGAGRRAWPGTVSWSSLDTDVATVTRFGELTAHTPGWARIVAASEDGVHRDTAIVAAGIAFEGITGGDDYGCGWTADGEGYCWGAIYNHRDGMLGTGSIPTMFTPSRIAGDLKFSTIAAGYRHACGIVEGALYCWGHGGTGAFNSLAPRQMDAEGPIEHVAVTTGIASGATCASGTAGLKCWGIFTFALPVNAVGSIAASLTGPVAVGQRHACALDGVGRAYCWGENQTGALGAEIPPELCVDDPCTGTNTPIPVDTEVRFADLESGAHFTCGLTADGQAFCWGTYDRFATSPGAPGSIVAVGGSLRFTSISAGPGQVCGLTATGELYCWGTGDGPQLMFDGMKLSAVAVGSTATCAITSDRDTRCIGGGSATGQGFDAGIFTTPIPIVPPGPLPEYLGLKL